MDVSENQMVDLIEFNNPDIDSKNAQLTSNDHYFAIVS
jgi:hypothetical protein